MAHTVRPHTRACGRGDELAPLNHPRIPSHFHLGATDHHTRLPPGNRQTHLLSSRLSNKAISTGNLPAIPHEVFPISTLWSVRPLVVSPKSSQSLMRSF